MKITEIFLSIQGESTRAGLPTVFVRCTGCNLACVYCDTGYARSGGTDMSVDAILGRVASFGIPRVTVTGGEPLLQADLPDLCGSLVTTGMDVQVETNGSLDTGCLPQGTRVILDVKTPGSGMHLHNLYANLDRLRPGDEVKFVITGREDFDWALDTVRRYGLEHGTVLFSAAAGRLEPGVLADWLLAARRAGIRLQVQLHRWLWPPGPGR
jgi:7-carboxy-7-deazaguanine synthase